MQGFNMGRYVPPEVEGTTTGNRLHGRRAPGAGPSPTVRFEMPFAVWCGTCPQPTLIGQGVRFNAEKRRVGSYHSTPVWAFCMRHADCGGAIEVRTDPQNTAYVVVAGGKRRDHGDDGDGEGEGVVATGEQRASAFAALEKTIADRQQLRAADERIVGLLEASARHWDDPYARNQRLRRAFRAARHARERDAAADDDLRDRMGLAIDLVPASEDDARRAARVNFGAPRPSDADADGHSTGAQALAKPLFGSRREARQQARDGTNRPPSKAERAAAQRRAGLVSELVSKSRAAQDPFLRDSRADAKHASLPPRWPGVKRRRTELMSSDEPRPVEAPAQQTTGSGGLVEYDSD